jgi:Raf kinase inhibitor-like YbhB/YbcL family protein
MRLSLNLFLVALVASPAMAQQAAPAPTAPAVPGMALSSTSIEDGGIIPDKYTQKATTYVSPELEWKNVPAAGVVSYTLILHDPDNAGMKKTADTLHWMVFNIPGTATKLDEGVTQGTATLPDGSIQGKNARGTPGYLGPGAGALGPYHHYTFELYALDTKLTLGPDATRADVLAAMDGHVVGKAVMFARFHR